MGRRGRKKKGTTAPEVYEVEKVSNHSFDKCYLTPGSFISYSIKWLGYSSSENTYQVANEFQSWKTIVDYWRKRIEEPGRLGPLTDKELEIAHAMMIIQEWQKESVMFYCDDANLLKIPIKTYGWEWLTGWWEKSEDQPTVSFQQTLELYEKQANLICENFRNHPVMKVVNWVDTTLPIPLSKLLCTIDVNGRAKAVKKRGLAEYGSCEKGKVTMSEEECKNTVERIKERIDSLDKFGSDLKDFSTNTFCQNFELRDSFLRPMQSHPRRAKLCLKRHSDNYWDLVAHESIDVGATIMLLTGERRSSRVATACMKKHGEIVALSNYISISNTMCLDVTNRHGFDRYIQHSCDPNCYVEITYPYRRPLCAPLCIIKAKKHINSRESLTIDWYERFERPDPTVDYSSGKTKRDHVICGCDASADVCRKILWVERLNDETKYADMSKKKRLSRHKDVFVGLPLPQTQVDDRLTDEAAVESEEDEYTDEEVTETEEEGTVTETETEEENDENRHPRRVPVSRRSR